MESVGPVWPGASQADVSGRTGAKPPLHVLCSLGVLLLFFLLQGCMKLGPDFETPEAPLAEAWSQSEEAKVKPESADYSQWWQAFNDPVIDRLIETA